MPPLRDFKPRTPNLFRTRVGARIRETRESLNFTQREIASRSALRPDRLAKYESGAHPPTVYALTKIAETLSRPVDFLLPELHLPNEVDRDLYRICRDLWLYPEEFRAHCVQVLRIFLASATQMRREGRPYAASRL